MPNPTMPHVLPSPTNDEIMAAATSESQLQDAVTRMASRFGWLVHHCRPGLDRSGHWATPIQGDAGFPDLVLVRERTLFIELKAVGAKLGPAQERWRHALVFAGAEWRCWTPMDWRDGTVDKDLRR